MIQELLGVSSGNFIPTPESKISITAAPGGVLPPPIPTTPSPSSTTATTSNVATATSSNSENQNLRCPRCDSSNTKFCYYNNYNLTQPRHFCKTCRRYWTKGGALRNVPIGGGCRKNKSVGGMSSSSVAKSTSAAAAKMKTVSSAELGGSRSSSSGLGAVGGGFDHQDLPASPILWGSPQNSQLLALLRASHSQNPNPSPSLSNSISNNAVAVSVKEEGSLMASHMGTDPMGSNGPLNGPRSPGFDLAGSFWRSNQDHQLLQQQNMGLVLGEHQNSGIQELYQRLRSSSSSANYCSEDSSTLFLGSSSTSSSSSPSLAIVESGQVLGGGGGIGLGYWNQSLSSWSDLPTTNGASAYP